VFVALGCCIALSAQAENFSAKVIVVMDGDTVMVLRDGQKIKVRLANIDAPEKEQEFGRQSRESLLEMVGRKQVQIDSQAFDQYGRIIGSITVDGLDANREQVRRGMAWEYSNFHTDKTYVALQDEARQARRGLWVQSDPQAPWQWRKLHSSGKANIQKQPAASKRATPVMLYDVVCGNKRRCAQMVSCEEAYFYLTRCGVKTLDANGDGVPCEALCSGK